MKIFTRRQKIDTVALRWKEHYNWNDQGWGKIYGWYGDYPYSKPERSEEVYHQLLALPPLATRDQVDAIIGNTGWTSQFCSECEKDSDIRVQLGDDPPEIESNTVVCLDCLRQAIAVALGEAQQ